MTVAAIETPVLAAWHGLAYHGYCPCATCGTPAYCCGLNIDSRVCVGCFEFTHDCHAPNYRRRGGGA